MIPRGYPTGITRKKTQKNLEGVLENGMQPTQVNRLSPVLTRLSETGTDPRRLSKNWFRYITAVLKIWRKKSNNQPPKPQRFFTGYICICVYYYYCHCVCGKVSSNEAINMDYYIFEFPFILWEKKAMGLIKNKLVKGCVRGPPPPPKKVCSHVVTSVAQAGI
jgi:hypothetical protein